MTDLNTRLIIDRMMAIVRANKWEIERVDTTTNEIRITIVKRGDFNKTEKTQQEGEGI